MPQLPILTDSDFEQMPQLKDSDFETPPQQTKVARPPTFTEALGQGLYGVGEGVVNAAKGFGQLAVSASQPGAIAQGEIQRQQKLSQRPQTLGTMFERIPLLGPAVMGLGEDVQKFIQGTPEQAGEVLGRQGVPLLLGIRAAKGPAATTAAKAAAQTSTDSRIASAASDLGQMFKKTGVANDETLGELAPRIEQAVTEIHREALEHPKLSNFKNIDAQGMKELSEKAYDRYWKEHYDDQMALYGKAPVNVSSVPEKLWEGIDKEMPSNAPLVAKVKQMSKDFEKPWTVGRLRMDIKKLNAETRSQDFQAQIGKPEAGLKLRRLDALRDIANERLAQLTGEDYKAINSNVAALKDVQDLSRRAAAVQRGRNLTEGSKGYVGKVIEAGEKFSLEKPLSNVRPVIKSLANRELTPDQLAARSMKRMGGTRIRPKPETLTAPPAQPPSNNPAANTPLVRPGEFNQSMNQYLDLNNVSPEAQQFLGYPPKPKE